MIRAINLNYESRQSAGIPGPPPGYNIDYTSDHTDDEEMSWGQGSIRLAMLEGSPDQIVTLNGVTTRSSNVGERIRIDPARFVRRSREDTEPSDSSSDRHSSLERQQNVLQQHFQENGVIDGQLLS